MSVVKVIPHSNGNYFVSDNGDVYTRPRRGQNGGKLKQRLNNNGYSYVELRINKKKKKGLIHRLVAMAFLDNPDNKPCVNHKDGNKQNNSIENLEWCTYSENMKHAVSLGLNVVPNLRGENHPMHKLTAEKVRQIRELYDNGSFVSSIAEEFKITTEQIYNIVNHKQWRDVN